MGAETGSRQGETQGGGGDKEEAASPVGRSRGCRDGMRHLVRSGKDKVWLCKRTQAFYGELDAMDDLSYITGCVCI